MKERLHILTPTLPFSFSLPFSFRTLTSNYFSPSPILPKMTKYLAQSILSFSSSSSISNLTTNQEILLQSILSSSSSSYRADIQISFTPPSSSLLPHDSYTPAFILQSCMQLRKRSVNILAVSYQHPTNILQCSIIICQHSIILLVSLWLSITSVLSASCPAILPASYHSFTILPVSYHPFSILPASYHPTPSYQHPRGHLSLAAIKEQNHIIPVRLPLRNVDI